MPALRCCKHRRNGLFCVILLRRSSAVQNIKLRCGWRFFSGHFLEGFANEDHASFSTLGAAQQSCEELGQECSGVTSNVMHQGSLDYSTRRGELYSSPYGDAEASYVKANCSEDIHSVLVADNVQEHLESRDLQETTSVDAIEVECDGEMFRIVSDELALGFTNDAVTCTWHLVRETAFIPGHVNDVPLAGATLESAQARCTALGQTCGGVTKQECNAKPLYTLRSGQHAFPSPQGEASWLKMCSISIDQVSAEVQDDEEDEPLPPSADSCGQYQFEKFRVAAAEYYRTSILPVALMYYLGEILRLAAFSGWTYLASLCAPAALQTMLLRAEERFFVDQPEHESLKASYLDLMHDSIGVISPSAWDGWVLSVGWRRVADLQKMIRVERHIPTIDFVICHCSVPKPPGPGYALVVDDLDWLYELLLRDSNQHKNNTRVFVMEKCADSGNMLTLAKDHADIQRRFRPITKFVDVQNVHDELRADDATAYLAHIAARYDQLADWTFFLHADAPEHIHPFRLMEEVLVAAQSGMLSTTRFPFLYLTHNYLDLETSKFTWDNYGSPDLWKHLFGSSITPSRNEVAGYCCVQFLVPKRLMLLRSQSWYSYALQWFQSARSYWRLFPAGQVVTWQDLTCRTPSQLWMPWWHIVFGEDLRCPERHRDARMPLFVQMRSIPPKDAKELIEIEDDRH